MTELLVLLQLKIEKRMLNARHGHAGACPATVTGSILLCNSGHTDAMEDKGGRECPACFRILNYPSEQAMGLLWVWLPAFLQETLYTNDQIETERLTNLEIQVVHYLTVTNLFCMSSKSSL